MLRKVKLDDGGLGVETALHGPAVFLDVWAVRDFSDDRAQALRERFASALRARRGSLLVSSSWFTELDTLKGNARQRAEAFFASLGAHWLAINPIVSVVAERESLDVLGASLSQAVLGVYVSDRCGELLRAEIDPHSLSDDSFFSLSRTLVWAEQGLDEVDDPDVPDVAQHLDEGPELLGPAERLGTAARLRAEADCREQRRDKRAHLKLYPSVLFASAPIMSVHNAVWREVTRRSPGRRWMTNDGFDVAHLIPVLTLGGLVAVDKVWHSIAGAVLNELPSNHVRLYRPGELDALVRELEESNSVTGHRPGL